MGDEHYLDHAGDGRVADEDGPRHGDVERVGEGCEQFREGSEDAGRMGDEHDPDHDGDKRARRWGRRALVGLGGVLLVAGGGYLGYRTGVADGRRQVHADPVALADAVASAWDTGMTPDQAAQVARVNWPQVGRPQPQRQLEEVLVRVPARLWGRLTDDGLPPWRRGPGQAGLRVPIAAAAREAVLARAAGACESCDHADPLHIDHLIPRKWGGSDHLANLQGLCRRCNSTFKGARLHAGDLIVAVCQASAMGPLATGRRLVRAA